MCKIVLDEWQTVISDQTPCSVVSDLGLHCLLRPVCPNIKVIMVTNSAVISLDNSGYQVIVFLFLDVNIFCWYSLEAPR